MTTDTPGEAPAYAQTWLAPDDLDQLNARIHDGVPIETLMERARGYRDWIFDAYPQAQPNAGDEVLELGSGVGWIMEAVLERFAPARITGLDISENMIARAQERFSDPRADFLLYDGLQIPLADGTKDVVFSVATMQHIEKHVAFLLFEELYRIVKPGGHGLIHLLSVEHLRRSAESTYHDECLHHILNQPTHWHHYYSFEELLVLFSDEIGVSEFDVAVRDTSVVIHFSKGGSNKFIDPAIDEMRYANLRERAATPQPAPAARSVIRRLLG
jgi:ubiquinone/menaquinone biosynthesis C-methylase UbiE